MGSVVSGMRITYGDEVTVRVRNAVEGLLAEGERVTFYAVADRAEVARSTLYRRDDLKAIIIAARSGCAITERADKLEALRLENERLRGELEDAASSIHFLRGQLAKKHRLCNGGAEYLFVTLSAAA